MRIANPREHFRDSIRERDEIKLLPPRMGCINYEPIFARRAVVKPYAVKIFMPKIPHLCLVSVKGSNVPERVAPTTHAKGSNIFFSNLLSAMRHAVSLSTRGIIFWNTTSA